MPTFRKSYDFIEMLKSIRHACSIGSIYEQVFWLHQLLLIIIFLVCKSENEEALREYPQSYELPKKALDLVITTSIGDANAFRALGRYRNKYAHGAFMYARDEFELLLREYKEDLIKMADYVGIELNFERTKLGAYA